VAVEVVVEACGRGWHVQQRRQTPHPLAPRPPRPTPPSLARPRRCYLRYLADDGSGNSIIIPSFMVTKEDGATIIANGAGARGSIWASMKWDMPASDGSIKYELWSHSNDENAYE
jgi:hypothetical protein